VDFVDFVDFDFYTDRCTSYITLEGWGVGSRLRYIRYIGVGVGVDRALYNARQLQVVHGS